MSADTARPSNEGSGRKEGKKEVQVENKVEQAEITSIFEERNYDDVRLNSSIIGFSEKELTNAEANGSNTSSSTSSGAGKHTVVDEKDSTGIEEKFSNGSVEFPLYNQNEKTKTKRAIKARREEADREQDARD